MRKNLRLLMLALMLLVVPNLNAREDIVCIPGNFVYFGVLGWHCAYREDGTHCLLCGYTITVQG